MKCIRNICLYLKKYISDKQFERIFYQDIDDFKSILEENIYWKILSSNFNKKIDGYERRNCNKEEVIESLEKLVILCEKAEKENKIIRCRKLTVKLTDNREER